MQPTLRRLPAFSKQYKLKNIHQNLDNPKDWSKRTQKFYDLDPRYESLFEDPLIRKNKFVVPKYQLDLRHKPDDQELMLDITNFDSWQYVKKLAKSKYADLEEHDKLPYWLLQASVFLTLHFVLQEIALNTMFYPEDLEVKPVLEQKSNQFNYDYFERELEQPAKLFQRAQARIWNS